MSNPPGSLARAPALALLAPAPAALVLAGSAFAAPVISSPSTLQSNSRPLLRLPLEESAPEEQGQEEGQEEGRQVNLLPVGAGGLEGWLYEHEEMARRQAGCGEI